MSCPNCGGDIIGDGFTTVRHCENVTDVSDYEPDADVVYCVDLCPDCGAPLASKWSGVQCTECSYFYCL